MNGVMIPKVGKKMSKRRRLRGGKKLRLLWTTMWFFFYQNIYLVRSLKLNDFVKKLAFILLFHQYCFVINELLPNEKIVCR